MVVMYTFREVKYFHPSGAGLPNGSHYQKGGFLNECRKNMNAFVLDEGVQDERDEKSACRGGIIVFAENADAEQISSMDISWNDEDCIYSLGQFFRGTYTDDKGVVFNDNSVCLYVRGLTSMSLCDLTEVIARRLKLGSVLLKDLNTSEVWQVLRKVVKFDRLWIGHQK